jgi:F0F1-type ATP synthase assembly protein I
MPLITPEIRRQLKAVGRLSAAGIELAISTFIGAWAGSWLDGKLNTKPYLTVLGLALGTIAGFRSIYHAAREATRREQDERKE